MTEQELTQKHLLAMHSPVSWKGPAEGGISAGSAARNLLPRAGWVLGKAVPSRHSEGCPAGTGSAGTLRSPNESTARRERRARGGGKRQKRSGTGSRGRPSRGGAGPGGGEAAAAAELRYRWVSLQDKERGRRGAGTPHGAPPVPGQQRARPASRLGRGRVGPGAGGCRGRAAPRSPSGLGIFGARPWPAFRGHWDRSFGSELL